MLGPEIPYSLVHDSSSKEDVRLNMGAFSTLANLYIGANPPFELLLGRSWQKGNFVSIDEREDGTYLLFKDPHMNVKYELAAIENDNAEERRAIRQYMRTHPAYFAIMQADQNMADSQIDITSGDDSHRFEEIPPDDPDPDIMTSPSSPDPEFDSWNQELNYEYSPIPLDHPWEQDNSEYEYLFRQWTEEELPEQSEESQWDSKDNDTIIKKGTSGRITPPPQAKSRPVDVMETIPEEVSAELTPEDSLDPSVKNEYEKGQAAPHASVLMTSVVSSMSNRPLEESLIVSKKDSPSFEGNNSSSVSMDIVPISDRSYKFNIPDDPEDEHLVTRESERVSRHIEAAYHLQRLLQSISVTHPRRDIYQLAHDEAIKELVRLQMWRQRDIHEPMYAPLQPQLRTDVHWPFRQKRPKRRGKIPSWSIMIDQPTISPPVITTSTTHFTPVYTALLDRPEPETHKQEGLALGMTMSERLRKRLRNTYNQHIDELSRDPPEHNYSLEMSDPEPDSFGSRMQGLSDMITAAEMVKDYLKERSDQENRTRENIPITREWGCRESPPKLEVVRYLRNDVRNRTPSRANRNTHLPNPPEGSKQSDYDADASSASGGSIESAGDSEGSMLDDREKGSYTYLGSLRDYPIERDWTKSWVDKRRTHSASPTIGWRQNVNRHQSRTSSAEEESLKLT